MKVSSFAGMMPQRACVATFDSAPQKRSRVLGPEDETDQVRISYREIKEAFDVDRCIPRFCESSASQRNRTIWYCLLAQAEAKSTIIKLLTERKESTRRLLRVEGRCPTVGAKVACSTANSTVGRQLVDQVGKELHEAIRTLNSIGLSEAHL
jgi:hypothetical protein